MTLTEIYDTYTPGSEGFCIAVETHCNLNVTREETARIAAASPDARSFKATWEEMDWWKEDTSAAWITIGALD